MGVAVWHPKQTQQAPNGLQAALRACFQQMCTRCYDAILHSNFATCLCICLKAAVFAGVCVQRRRGSLKAIALRSGVLLWPLVLSRAKQGAANSTGWQCNQCDKGG